MEEFEKMGKQGAGIEELLKQLLDEVASNRSSLARVEESMRELKSATEGSTKRIEAVEKKMGASPPPPPPPPLSSSTFPLPSGRAPTGKSPPTAEKVMDLTANDNNLRVETRNQGIGEGILGIPPRPPEVGASHSAPTTPNFRTDPVFGKYLSVQEAVSTVAAYPSHKHLPKLDFPKFNGDNSEIWAKKCEVYFDVFSVPESLRTRYATVNFIDRAALWLETVEVSGRIEDWSMLCSLVFKRWDKDQHHIFMRQILVLKQTGSVAEYIEKFEDLRHQLLLHEPSASNVFFVAHFLDGLRDDIRFVITIHRPQDMETVCAHALMQEEEAEGGRRKSVQKADHQTPRSSWKAPDRMKDHKKVDDRNQKSDDKLASLLSYHRAKGLCFKCGEKWGKGHTCPAQVPLHIVEEMVSAAQQSGPALSDPNEEFDSDEGLELLAVFNGKDQSQVKTRKPTMRLLGWIGKQHALILVDSGSAATFIDLAFAEKCGLPKVQVEHSNYTVADGGLMTSDMMVPKLQWCCLRIHILQRHKSHTVTHI
jgi:hypothetical protein